MDIWEELVLDYLTLDRRVFVQPQYGLGDNTWAASLDFLALDFAKKTIWVCEVSGGSSGFDAKCAQFTDEYMPRIRHELRQTAPMLDLDNWTFGMWLFVPNKNVDWARGLLDKNSLSKSEVTAFEDIVSMFTNGGAPWEERHHNFEAFVRT